MTEPRYWMYETSGQLEPVVHKYLAAEPMTGQDITIMRAYLRQWIMAPVWDACPGTTDVDRRVLAILRFRVDSLTSREALDKWITEAEMEGIEPL